MDKETIQKKYEALGMHPKWIDLLEEVLLSEELSTVYRELGRLREGGAEIFPKQEHIWRAFSFDPSDLKVIILGQDPYHTPGVANGYAFAVGKDKYAPPSLRNIITVLRSRYGDKPRYSKALGGNDYREVWGEHQASQGVLLLNRALTVERGKAGSHLDLWKPVISKIMQVLLEFTHPLIFILWGSPAINMWNNEAEKFEEECGALHHHISIASTHPSPFSWEKTSKDAYSFKEQEGCFEMANDWLEIWEKEPIDW